jgi:hypothetical protein
MKRALAFTMLALLTWATATPAAIPQTISYQGILREAGGTIVADGNYNLTFKLYAAAVGGTPLWTETQTLAVEDGVFNALLGSVTALTLDFGNQYYLGVAVGVAAELTPRIALASAPYSLNADRLDGLSSGSFASSTHDHALNDLSDVGVPTPLDGQVLTYSTGDGEWVAMTPAAGDDGDWVINGDNIYHLNGRVGVGMLPAKAPVLAARGGKGTRTPIAPKLGVESGSGQADAGVYSFYADNDEAADGRAALYGLRNSGLGNAGTGYGVESTNNAVTGANWWGDSHSFGVGGFSYFDEFHTGGVLGADWWGNYWGALGYQDGTGMDWGLYTPSGAHLGGLLQIPAGAADGRVLTSDASGWATWQAPPTGVGGSGTSAYLPRWTAATTLGNSLIYDNGSRIGIGTTTPDRALEVNNASGSAIIGQCTHVSANDYVGVEGYSVPEDYYGIGGRFTGGFIGLQSLVYPTGSGSYYGAWASASGGIGGAKYGAYTHASGGGLNYGIYSQAYGGTANYAGYFSGDVHVTGTLSKSAGSFKIDHPLDPEHKTLSHSFVESPDMKNVYDGVVVLGADGAAWVEMPEWFEALNRDFRYQLTAIGAPGPNLYIAEEITANRFRIAGGAMGMKVSWMVTGIRQDAFANAHRIPVEELKSAKDQGRYLNPDVFGQPETKGVDYENNHPELQKGER